MHSHSHEVAALGKPGMKSVGSTYPRWRPQSSKRRSQGWGSSWVAARLSRTGCRSCGARIGSWKHGPDGAPLLLLILVSLAGRRRCSQRFGKGLLAYVLIEFGRDHELRTA